MPKPFYNALNYTLGDGSHWDQPRPNIKKWLRPFGQAFSHIWMENDRLELPADHLLKQVAERMDGNLSFADIEHLPTDIRKVSKEEVDKTARTFTYIADRIHHYAPGIRFGFYKFPIIKEYWGTINIDYNRLVSWYEACDYLAYSGLLDAVDVLYPSLYAHHPNQDEWVTFATRNLRLARKYGKPVIPFIWPQFHPGSSGGAIPWSFLDGDYWKRILETVADHADGAVIWGHRKSGSPWDETRPWWQETVKFIEG